MQRCTPLKSNHTWILRRIDWQEFTGDGEFWVKKLNKPAAGQGQTEVRANNWSLNIWASLELQHFIVVPWKIDFCFVLQLQRLKRSLSFKSVMRSKSMDNFFQRNGDTRLPSALITPARPASPPPSSESPLGYERSPSLSPSISPNPSLSSHSPSVSPSMSQTSRTQPKTQGRPVAPLKTHCFQEHVFRKAVNCQRCKHVIHGESNYPLFKLCHIIPQSFFSNSFSVHMGFFLQVTLSRACAVKPVRWQPTSGAHQNSLSSLVMGR